MALRHNAAVMAAQVQQQLLAPALSMFGGCFSPQLVWVPLHVWAYPCTSLGGTPRLAALLLQCEVQGDNK